MNSRFLTRDECPIWFSYPAEFNVLLDQGILRFDPWFIIEGPQLRERIRGLSERFPERNLMPFARRGDNDDVACWEKDIPDKVVIIHDFASAGYEQHEIYEDFWDWFRSAIELMIENN